jgi:hypothetical protein
MAPKASDILASVRLIIKMIIIHILVGSEVLQPLDMKNTIFWGTTLCSPEDEGDIFLRNIG